MAFDFPNNPTVGQIATGPGGQAYQFDGNKWMVLGGTTPGWIVISDTVPANPAVGQFWLDSLGMQLYVYYQDPTSAQWIPVSNQPVSNTYGNPNKFINPFVEIDQANEGAAVNPTNTAYVVDGIRSYISSSAGGVASAARGSGGPAYAPYYLGYNMSTGATSVPAGDIAYFYALIEADDLFDTQFGSATAQPLTLSFWIAASITGTYYVTVRNAAANRSYVAPYTITTAGTWQRVTMTIPGDTAGTWAITGNALGMTVGWVLGAGTNFQTASPNSWQAGNLLGVTGMSNALMTTTGAYLRLGPYKLEVGSTATPNLRQNFQSELQRCQRYYEKSWNPGVPVGTTASNAAHQSICYFASTTPPGTTYMAFYKTTKRANPTVTVYDFNGVAGNIGTYVNAGYSTTAALVLPSGMNQHGVGPTGSVANLYAVGWDYVADARL